MTTYSKAACIEAHKKMKREASELSCCQGGDAPEGKMGRCAPIRFKAQGADQCAGTNAAYTRGSYKQTTFHTFREKRFVHVFNAIRAPVRYEHRWLLERTLSRGWQILNDAAHMQTHARLTISDTTPQRPPRDRRQRSQWRGQHSRRRTW